MSEFISEDERTLKAARHEQESRALAIKLVEVLNANYGCTYGDAATLTGKSVSEVINVMAGRIDLDNETRTASLRSPGGAKACKVRPQGNWD